MLEGNIFSFPCNLQRYLEQKTSEVAKSHEQTAHMLEQIDARLAEYGRQRQRLLDLYLHGHIDEALFSKTKSGIDQESEPLEKLRNEMQTQRAGRDAQHAQVASAITFVTRLLDELPRATLEEKRRVIEALDVHVVYRDLDTMRMFFDLPAVYDQSEAEVDEYRWKSVESIQSIQWDDSMSIISG